jgi:phosphoglycolate phosphatase-like HAD superfamily hydrolase
MNKTLIFDFDGTLSDTLPFAINFARDFNRRYKLLNDGQIDMEKFRSMSSDDFLKYYKIPMLKFIFFLFCFGREFNKHVEEMNTFKGLPEVLIELKNKGVKMGIVTSNPKRNVIRFLKHNNLEYFDFIYSSIHYFHKYRILDMVERKFKLKEQDIIYIGDEVRDIKAARQAGEKVASVTWGYNIESILRENNPDYVLYQPKDLLNLVN